MILKRVVENYTQTQENNLVFKVNNTFAKDSVRVTVEEYRFNILN